MRKKPVGTSGIVRAETGGKSEFLPNKLPDSKAGIELQMLEGALRALEFAKLNPYQLAGEPVQLEENSFDFELPTTDGTHFLDLVEFAPIAKYRGYEGAPYRHNAGQLADEAWGFIKKKSEKYRLTRRGKVHLLIYITDWRFLLSDSVLALLTLWCGRRSHGFRSIVYYMPIADGAGVSHVLFPGVIPPFLETVEGERQLRSQTFTNIDPRAFTPTPDGQGIMFDVQF